MNGYRIFGNAMRRAAHWACVAARNGDVAAAREYARAAATLYFSLERGMARAKYLAQRY